MYMCDPINTTRSHHLIAERRKNIEYVLLTYISALQRPLTFLTVTSREMGFMYIYIRIAAGGNINGITPNGDFKS